ncbi:hypothetical protein EKN56_12655 [Limnobaculum zhutongyuii]|uniref:Uncharacterized protein n=1 Tax=Limnobaculum zhutongyuii TaxID=2498113 RepID=A0A411WLQ5_9GAMM|nr:hypothetical protein [Limnobaculum zhutongyuii]QBH97169.1 hypothetical protein EKN56_12655 [Limnobaculum zhutongyuii]TQS88428.1 hypothetical protein ELQ32_10440 [Limnobaculum zhutongyuii]
MLNWYQVFSKVSGVISHNPAQNSNQAAKRSFLRLKESEMAIGSINYKISIKQHLKWVLVIAALIKFNWLANKCFRAEVITGGYQPLNGPEPKKNPPGSE